MSFSNRRFRWLAVFGGLICLFVGNTGTAQDASSRDRVSPADGPSVQQVTDPDFEGACNIPNLGVPPCNDVLPSSGGFEILVDLAFRDNMVGCPGYDPETGILEHNELVDLATVIGRSWPHQDGDPLDTGGNPVGKNLTPISDGTFSLVPEDKDEEGFAEGPADTREVHTEIRSLNLCDLLAPPPYLPCVRAGVAASVEPFPAISPGEVESKSDASKDPKQDFPGEGFFNIFVEVDLPQCGAFTGAVLYNDDPLLVTNNDVRGFPPVNVEGLFLSENARAVPVYFKLPDLVGGKWLPGNLFGWLTLSAHGMEVPAGGIRVAMDQTPRMCVDPNTLGCYSGCLMCEGPGCSEKVGEAALVEETNFSPVELAIVGPHRINRFVEAVQDILAKQDPPAQVAKVANLQDAIGAIQAKPGSHVVIFGHGSSGHFRIGDDDLADPANQLKFITALKGQFKTLTLYGCEVSDGAEGQAFLKKLTAGLQRPVHTWTGKVYAFGHDVLIPPDMQNRFYIEADTDKKEIPAVTEWGMVVMILLVLAAGTVVIRRARAVAAQA